jgi:hypothetical protein
VPILIPRLEAAMKSALGTLAAVLLLASTADAADVAGVRFGRGGTPGINTPALFTLVDAWNDIQVPVGGTTYAAHCFDYPYVPSKDYTLVRIEFFAGDLAGPVTVSVHANVGSGHATGPALASVAYQETSPRRWQGGDLIPSLSVHAGTLYYVKYQIVPDALCSMGMDGVPIAHGWSDLCLTWNASDPIFPWMARFYGDVTTAARPHSWGAIKSLYR